MKLNTVWRWWDRFRVGLSKEFASHGIEVRPLQYDNLSEREQQIVYNYWATGELLKED